MSIGIYKDFNPEDVDVTPFVAHKRWTVSNSPGLSLDATVEISGSYYTGSSVYVGTYSTSSLNAFISGSSNEPAYNGKYQFLIHSNIDKMFYRFAQKGIENDIGDIALQSHDSNLEHRDLHKRINVASIPQQLWGEGIKRGSVFIKDKGGATTINIADDKYTNLYDKGIDTGSMVSDDKLLIHLPFSDGYKYIHKNSVRLGDYPKRKNGLNYKSVYPHRCTTRGISFEPGMHGYGLNLKGTSGSYILTKRLGSIDPETDLGRNQEFAVSMWLKIPTSQSVSHSLYGGWETINQFGTGDNAYSVKRRTNKLHATNTVVTKRKSPWTSTPFPYHIEVGNSWGSDDGKVIFKRSNGHHLKTIKTPLKYNDNTWRHFLFQKTGSMLETYVNGKRVATESDFNTTGRLKGTTVSRYLMTLGGIRYHIYKYGQQSYMQGSTATLGLPANTGGQAGSGDPGLPAQMVYPSWKHSYYRPTGVDTNKDRYTFDRSIEPMLFSFTGSVDELRVYHQAIPSASIISLSESINNTNKIGNIFYDYGLATITDPRSKYSEVFKGSGASNGWYLSFQNNWTIYENEYICHVKSDDFDISMNPTLREDNVITDDRLKGMVSHSDFSPYITTVGLYDDNFDLLATAKLAQPLKKPTKMDTTIVVRFDK